MQTAGNLKLFDGCDVGLQDVGEYGAVREIREVLSAGPAFTWFRRGKLEAGSTGGSDACGYTTT